jgi:hypothetical protein
MATPAALMKHKITSDGLDQHPDHDVVCHRHDKDHRLSGPWQQVTIWL